VLLFRHADPRFPFLWEGAAQPAARWHGDGEGPAHYLADTADGAWAELLRHEEIRDPEDLATVRRAMWAIEVPDEPGASPDLPEEVLTGGLDSYPACRDEARRLRTAGATRLEAPSAALLPGTAHGWLVDGGERPGPDRDGRAVVLFGPRPDVLGWQAAAAGRPHDRLLPAVRPLKAAEPRAGHSA
jgi:hypothetical protein